MEISGITISSCPKCRAPVREPTGNVLVPLVGWSDGLIGYPSIEPLPFVRRCPHCSKLSFQEDAEPLGTVPLGWDAKTKVTLRVDALPEHTAHRRELLIELLDTEEPPLDALALPFVVPHTLRFTEASFTAERFKKLGASITVETDTSAVDPQTLSWATAPWFRHCTPNELLSAWNEGALHAPTHERLLRLFFWKTENNQHRQASRFTWVDRTPFQAPEDNVPRLLELHADNDPFQLDLRAALLRTIGRFDEAIAALERASTLGEGFWSERVRTTLCRLARAQCPCVVLLWAPTMQSL